MSGDIIGDGSVLRTMNVGRRLNEGLTAQTISTPLVLDKHSAKWQKVTAASAQDVILPDATTLALGWEQVVYSVGAGTVTVKSGAATPVAIQNIITGRAYRFTLVANSDAAGEWYIDFLEDAESLVSERYPHTFDATTSWGSASGGYYSMTISAATHGRGSNVVNGGLFRLVDS